MEVKSDNKYLIFIDTQVYLDFYRLNSEASKESLNKIEENKDRLILSNQIEMEFKKHRQSEIYKLISAMKDNIEKELDNKIPLSIREDEILKRVKECKTTIGTIRKDIQKSLSSIIRNKDDDKIYKRIDSILKHKSKYNLSNTCENLKEIKNLAKERFFCGYPPRKDKDLSMGDAINWEWIIHCAKQFNKSVILVSRDEDYGIIQKELVYLNDWLEEEVKERLGNDLKIRLVNKLSDAFKEMSIELSKETVKEESRVIREDWTAFQNDILKRNIELVTYANHLQKRLEGLTSSKTLREIMNRDRRY